MIAEISDTQTPQPVHTLEPPTSITDERVQRVHRLVREWQDGTPLVDVRRACSGNDRYLATRATPPDHPLFDALMTLLDRLIASDPSTIGGYHYQTKHGAFSDAELRAVDARVTKGADNRLQIAFPERYPWDRTPMEGDPGEPGTPIYRSPEDQIR